MPIVATGEKFSVDKVSFPQERLDQEAVQQILTPEQFASCKKVISVTQFKTKRILGQKAEFRMPNLGNATPEGLADQLGEVREQMAELKKLEGVLKQALQARIDPESEGEQDVGES